MSIVFLLIMYVYIGVLMHMKDKILLLNFLKILYQQDSS